MNDLATILDRIGLPLPWTVDSDGTAWAANRRPALDVDPARELTRDQRFLAGVTLAATINNAGAHATATEAALSALEG